MPSVHAVLSFPATGAEHRLAVVRVRVEDVSRADASAEVVASTEVTDVLVPADGISIAVDLPYDDPAAGAALTVRAHGSASGASEFAAGDFLSTQSIPPQPEVEVPLRAI